MVINSAISTKKSRSFLYTVQGGDKWRYEWYADVFLLTNLLMDMSAMFAAALLLNDRLRLGRCLAVCVAGVTGSTVLLILLKKISGLQYHFTYGNPSADDVWGIWGKRPRAVFTHAFDHLSDFVCDGWGAEQYWGVAWKQYIGNSVVRDGSGTFVLYLSDPTACHPADLSGGTVGRDRTCHGRCLLRYRKSAERSTDGKAGLYFATGSVSAICY